MREIFTNFRSLVKRNPVEIYSPISSLFRTRKTDYSSRYFLFFFVWIRDSKYVFRAWHLKRAFVTFFGIIVELFIRDVTRDWSVNRVTTISVAHLKSDV